MQKTEYQKMLAGELYDGRDEVLMQMRINARALMQEYNQTAYDLKQREVLLQKMLGKIGNYADIQTPFFVDYGTHIEVGDYFFANYNCVFLDCNFIKIGSNVFLGPNVQIYAAYHPVIAEERIKGPEFAAPVTIHDNVWVGGSSIILAGTTIGENTTIGAGSIVTKSIPANVVAVGNPCRVTKQL